MSDDLRQALEGMIKKFGADLGVPKVDVDRLIETHQKNFDALVESVQATSNSAKQVAAKQREIIEPTLNGALTLAKEMKLGAVGPEFLNQQREVVGRVLDKTIASTIAIAEESQSLNKEILKIVGDRVSASASEIRASFPSNSKP